MSIQVVTFPITWQQEGSDSRIDEGGSLLVGDDTPQEPHDYLELIGDPGDSNEHHDYLELVGEPNDSDPLNVEIPLNSGNEYASLYTTETPEDGANETRDHAYTSLSNVQSDHIETTPKGEPMEGCTPQDIQDSLQLLEDPEGLERPEPSDTGFVSD